MDFRTVYAVTVRTVFSFDMRNEILTLVAHVNGWDLVVYSYELKTSDCFIYRIYSLLTSVFLFFVFCFFFFFFVHAAELRGRQCRAFSRAGRAGRRGVGGVISSSQRPLLAGGERGVAQNRDGVV